MESVSQFLKVLPPEEFDNLKTCLVKHLIEKRALDKYRFQGRLIVAIDGTGIYSFLKIKNGMQGAIPGDYLKSQIQQGVNLFAIPIDNLGSGIYMYRIDYRGEVKVGRFMVW